MSLQSKKFRLFFARYLQSDIAPSRFNQLATEIARTHFMSKDQFRRFAILGISQAVDAAFADHVITVEETDRIMELWNELQITKEEFEPSGTRVKLSKAAILRELDDGIVPHHAKIVGATPIN